MAWTICWPSPWTLPNRLETTVADLSDRILASLRHKQYQPLKPKALARKLSIGAPQYADFRRVLRSLLKQRRIEVDKNSAIRLTQPHGTVVGVYRSNNSGFGFVRPHPTEKGARWKSSSRKARRSTPPPAMRCWFVFSKSPTVPI